MKNTIRLMLGSILVVMFMLTVLVQPSIAAVQTGTAAPGFKLTSSGGGEQSLSDYKDQYVVLEWLNHDCPFVRKHYDSGNMQSLQKAYTEKGVAWLSIVSSAPGKQGYCTPEKAETLTKKTESSPTAVLLDPTGEVGKLYGAKTTPHIFIIDPNGTLIYQGAIDSVPSANPADIQGADNYVQLVLDAAMNGQPVENGSTKSYGCSVKY